MITAAIKKARFELIFFITISPLFGEIKYQRRPVVIDLPQYVSPKRL
jgi:hypothetical protein